MRVNFNGPVTDLDDKAIKERVGVQAVVNVLLEAGVPKAHVEVIANTVDRLRKENDAVEKEILLKSIILNCLQAPDKDASGEEMVDRMALALKIHGAQGEVEITEAEGKKILTLVQKFNPAPLPYFRIDRILKSASVKGPVQTTEVA